MALKSYILIGFHHIFKNQNIINIYMLQNLTPIFVSAAAAAPKLLQSCPTLCDPIDGSPSGSPVPGILQARTLEWGAIAFSNFVPTHPFFLHSRRKGASSVFFLYDLLCIQQIQIYVLATQYKVLTVLHFTFSFNTRVRFPILAQRGPFQL